MDFLNPPEDLLSRRAFLGQSGIGLGALAATSLLHGSAKGATNAGRGDLPHEIPKAKRVIYLFQSGGPSHIDLFDHKPELARRHGQQIPDSVAAGRRFSTMTGNPRAIIRVLPIGESTSTL